MKGYLPNVELRFYFCFTIILYLGLMYHVLVLSNSNLSEYSSMRDGWLGRKMDDFDVEWEVFKDLMRKYWYWFAIHLLSAEIYRLLRLKHISMLYFITGSVACLKIYNFRFYAALLMQTGIYYTISSFFKAKLHVWMFSAICLVILNALKFEAFFIVLIDLLNIDESKVHDFLVIFAWCILKNISFNLERVESNDNDKFNLLNCLGYVFYFPTFHVGPIVVYTRYMKMLDVDNREVGFFRKIKKLILQSLRLSFWFLITEIGLHYFYIHYIVMSKSLESLSTMTIFGLGFLNGQFFCNKYVIQYGVAALLGEFDNISMPKLPKCICRVHKYSDMWKWFDTGLYEFLVKYIYAKILQPGAAVWKVIFASFITFFFIYIWHGFFDYILVWSIANCVSIIIEKFVYHIMEGSKFKRKAMAIVKSENNLHRLRAYIGAHVLIPAILSNFFFFGGMQFGYEFVKRTYLNGWWHYVQVSTTIFLLYPIAETIKRCENVNR